MGIQQLLPLLSKCTEQVNISQFEGWTVAVDAYCWLHKGSYACSEELLLNRPTDKYVQYCLKYIHMLQRYKIKPVLVFDGQKLQAKSQTEKERYEKRKSAATTAKRLLLDGNRVEAKKYLGQAISISPKMAHDVIEACRAIGVDCIVAQYEADAQLAYLSLSGLIHLVISEDSDLLVFGCRRVLFKLDLGGRGELIEQDRLGEVFGGDFSFEKFRYSCILSGCDYLNGLSGIGIKTALKIFRRAKQPDIKRILSNLSGYLGKSISMPAGYTDSFMQANQTFLYQLAYDPVERCVCPLNNKPKQLLSEEMPFAGRQIDAQLAFDLAVGNLNPMNLKPFSDDSRWQPKPDSSSIWSSSYLLPKTPPRKSKQCDFRAQSSVKSFSASQEVLASWSSSPSQEMNRKRQISSVNENKMAVVSYSENKRLKIESECRSAIIVEESDPEEENEPDCIVVSSDSFKPSSPTIISQTNRKIRRSFCSEARLSICQPDNPASSPYFNKGSSNGPSNPWSHCGQKVLSSKLASLHSFHKISSSTDMSEYLIDSGIISPDGSDEIGNSDKEEITKECCKRSKENNVEPSPSVIEFDEDFEIINIPKSPARIIEKQTVSGNGSTVRSRLQKLSYKST